MNREFKDQIPPEGGRKYRITENPDGTSGISDVTEYQQEGTPFGAKEAMELYDGIVPPGAVIPYAGSSAPDGWLLCDGRTLQSDRYPELYAAIGTTYGQNKPGSFKLPDLRGNVPAGASTGHDLASKTGAEKVTIGKQNLPSNGVTIAIQSTKTQSDNRNAVPVSWTNRYEFNANSLAVGDGTYTPLNVMQPTLYLNYIIKY